MKNTIRIGVLAVTGILLLGVIVIYATKDRQDGIVIGAIMPLTGDAATYGVAIKQGIELALDKVNAAGGIDGQPISAMFDDTKAMPKEGVAAAQKLISVNHVNVIIGAVASSVTLAVAPIAERSHVVLLSAASSSPKITSAGNYIFRNYPSDELEGRLVAEFAVQHNYKTAAVLTINNDYGNGLNPIFVRSYSDLKGNVLLNDRFPEGATNLRTLLTKVKQLTPQCVFIVGYGKELGTLVKQAKEIGLKTQFLSTVNFYDSQTLIIGGTAAEGVIFSSPVFDTRSAESHVVAFVSAFKSRFGKDPDVWSAHGYDALLLIAEAMRRSGTDADSIKEGLYSIRDFPGVSGLTSFDRNGDVLKEARFLTVKSGAFVPFE